MSHRFAAVVPVIDEREAIGAVVAELRQAGACCVFVVDGGSGDGTREAASAAGAIVVDEPRRGYGRACLTGGTRALATQPHAHDAVTFLDGDGSCDGAETRGLVDGLATSDVVLGRRMPGTTEPGAMPWYARLGNGLVAVVVSARTGRRVHDLPPSKAIRSDVLERLRLDEAGYGWTVQFVARALADPSLRIRELPVQFRRRRGGTSKVSGSPRASFLAGLSMIRVAVQSTRPRPVVVLMAKAPGDGHAKTRLAVDIGAQRTAELWAAILADAADDLFRAAVARRSDSLVILPRTGDVAAVREIVGARWTPVVQRRPGLPAALAEAFLAAFDRGADRAVAVAGDVPSLPPAYAADALDRLAQQVDGAVLGPSADGGYNLVGLRWRGAPRWWPRVARRRRRARLTHRLQTAFDVTMGGSAVLEATRRSLEHAGWTADLLATWSDVDDLTDLRGLDSELRSDRLVAPRTTAWIARHRDVVDGP